MKVSIAKIALEVARQSLGIQRPPVGRPWLRVQKRRRFYKAMKRQHAQRLVSHGEVLVSRLDAFGDGLPENLRDADEGKLTITAEDLEVGWHQNVKYVRGAAPGSPQEQRAVDFICNAFLDTSPEDCDDVFITGINVVSKTDISRSTVAWCMSNEPLTSLADTSDYDAIVEITHVDDVWKQLAKAAVASFSGGGLVDFGIADVRYESRDVPLSDAYLKQFPGFVKPESYFNESEVRFLVQLSGNAAHARRLITCPALRSVVRIFMVKDGDRWIQS